MTTCRNFYTQKVIIFQNIYSESANVNIKNEHADRNCVNSECFLDKHWLKSLTVRITHTNRCPAYRFGHQSAGPLNRPQALVDQRAQERERWEPGVSQQESPTMGKQRCAEHTQSRDS